MDVAQADGPKAGFVEDAAHPRELLRRWLRLSREVLSSEELERLFADTRRALGPEPNGPGFDKRHDPGEE